MFYLRQLFQRPYLAQLHGHTTLVVLPAICSNKDPLARDKTNQENSTALPRMVYLVAFRACARRENIGIPSAVPSLTMLNNVLSSHNMFIINTPFISEEWHKLLLNTTSFNKFSNIPNAIHSGFNMGIISPPSFTYTPPNHNSALSYPAHILSHIHNELHNHCYTGPFSCSCLEFLIGPFCMSPLGTIPKVGLQTEHRVIQDLSFPRNDPSLPSINDGIDPELFTCNWGTFNDVKTIVLKAPPNTEAATLDVDSAFRHCPIVPSQQSSFIIHWDDMYYIDHNAPFSATSSGGVFGKMADAFSSILKYKGFGPSKNWVDKFVFFRYPTSPDTLPPSFSYSLDDIYSLALQLGWPWKDSKTKPSSSLFKYLGFSWNLSSKTVEIPAKKRTYYLMKLSPWSPSQNFSRKDTESLLGTLVHCSLALPDGHSCLSLLSCFAASFNHFTSPFVQGSPSPTILTDIHWWCAQLLTDFCGSLISKPPALSPLEFWVDASSSWGIGIVFDDTWDAWKLKSGWNKDGCDIVWAKIVSIELSLLFAIHSSHSNTHFCVKSDNQGIITQLNMADPGILSKTESYNKLLYFPVNIASGFLHYMYRPSIT